MSIFDQAVELVRSERLRQDEKWGADREQHDMIWLTILAEEFGETAEAILKKQSVETTEELIQVAAVAVAWLENRLRRANTASTPTNGGLAQADNSSTSAAIRG